MNARTHARTHARRASTHMHTQALHACCICTHYIYRILRHYDRHSAQMRCAYSPRVLFVNEQTHARTHSRARAHSRTHTQGHTRTRTLLHDTHRWMVQPRMEPRLVGRLGRGRRPVRRELHGLHAVGAAVKRVGHLGWA